VYQFVGVCEGNIATTIIIEGGFGYDPIFIPQGSTHCFAQMSLEQKNRYSHRAKAWEQLAAFLVKNT
jgi:XTP/dITP diphosphohydrolase